MKEGKGNFKQEKIKKLNEIFEKKNEYKMIDDLIESKKCMNY